MAIFAPNPPLESLQSSHAGIALTAPLALKFPRRVAPFAAVLEPTAAAFQDLHSLLEPGESTYIVANAAPIASTGLSSKGPFSVAQMLWPAGLVPPMSDGPQILPLDCTHGAEMLALTEIAFPGFFRIDTCRMGPYFGIRNTATELIAMCGERMNIGRTHELSGLCTHPSHRGQGHAQKLLAHLIRRHQAAGLGSYLHASAENVHAIDMYRRMGFLHCGEFPMYIVTRSA
jgi:GNAT superfamily N-acetyltransferase